MDAATEQERVSELSRARSTWRLALWGWTLLTVIVGAREPLFRSPRLPGPVFDTAAVRSWYDIAVPLWNGAHLAAVAILVLAALRLCRLPRGRLPGAVAATLLGSYAVARLVDLLVIPLSSSAATTVLWSVLTLGLVTLAAATARATTGLGRRGAGGMTVLAGLLLCSAGGLEVATAWGVGVSVPALSVASWLALTLGALVGVVVTVRARGSTVRAERGVPSTGIARAGVHWTSLSGWAYAGDGLRLVRQGFLVRLLATVLLVVALLIDRTLAVEILHRFLALCAPLLFAISSALLLLGAAVLGRGPEPADLVVPMRAVVLCLLISLALSGYEYWLVSRVLADPMGGLARLSEIDRLHLASPVPAYIAMYVLLKGVERVARLCHERDHAENARRFAGIIIPAAILTLVYYWVVYEQLPRSLAIMLGLLVGFLVVWLLLGVWGMARRLASDIEAERARAAG